MCNTIGKNKGYMSNDEDTNGYMCNNNDTDTKLHIFSIELLWNHRKQSDNLPIHV